MFFTTATYRYGGDLKGLSFLLGLEMGALPYAAESALSGIPWCC